MSKVAISNAERLFNKELPQKENRPNLVKVGDQYVNPNDVSSIRYVKSNGLYIIDFISQPSPKYAFWVKKEDIGDIIQYFNVISTKS